VASGRSWIDQQWLAQVVFALVYRVGAWQALVVLRSILIGATFTFVYLSCRGVGAGRRASSLLALASFLATMLGLALRPQLFAFAVFAACVWLLVTSDRHPTRVWWIPVLVAVWANVHGSFFLGPVLLALAWVRGRRDPASRRLLIVTALSVVATLANPFGLGVWSYVASISMNPAITRTVSEWLPPTIHDLAGLAFFASVGATAVVFVRRTARVGWPTLLTLAVFLALGLQSGRGMFWWDLVVPSLVAAELGSSMRDDGRRAPAPMVLLTIAAVLCTGVAFQPWLRAPGAGTSLLDDAPARVTAAAGRVTPAGGRIFDAQRLGSWLEWALPDRAVFADSRIELLTADEWDDYLDVSSGVQGWQQVLDRYRVDVVVATTDQQGSLLPLIRRDPGWRQVYTDEDGSVFIRS
jgi:hypothetical protein